MRGVASCLLGSFTEPRVEHGHAVDRYVEIGSLTKALTGTVLTRLAAAGVLDPDEPVERVLPTVPAGTGITPRRLMTHTSGLPRLPPGISLRDPYRSFTDEALAALLPRLDRLLARPAGGEAEYSNFGYALLGAVLVAATGQGYEELLRERVLEPLGVTEVTSRPDPAERLVGRGLLGRDRRPWTMDGAILPAGGLWATPRAAAALLTGLVVERELGAPAPSWQRNGRVTWHNGATGDASVLAAATDDGRWVLLHRLGAHRRTDRDGMRALREAA
ncbi:serine hydrolase domain-containing protein [Kitasatospora sp. NPDC052896]|uniref:serine hydrolase domain-containing protein n=1 Tax=Kitasatospora sp. NPDC052896 TaxID=3364061 RepID=UPI0037C85F9C